MCPTLLEGAIAILLVWIGWRIGSLLGPRIIRRLRERPWRGTTPPDRKDKPPNIIDV